MNLKSQSCASSNGNYATDIDDQSANNYIYDSIGNLTKDVSEEIDSIIWNVYGKIERVVRTSASTKADLEFRYDAMGNRVCKIVKPRDGSGIVDQDSWTYTYYLRDASGNVIAVYDRDYSTPAGTYTDELSLKEDHLYGSSRVGIRTIDEVLCTTTYTYVSTGSNGVFTGTFSSRTATAASTTNYNHELKRKAFELSNHLGNVLVTVSDARTATNSSGTVSAFTAVIESAQDYYAFGSPMAGRTYTSSTYRYAFNGKEKDNELTEGSLDFGARVYESRLGRWMSVDPLSGKYSMVSSYAYVLNRPIQAVDPDGEDVIVLSDRDGANGTGHQALLVGNDKDGWTYISKDGYTGASGTEASAPLYVVKRFDNLEQFRNSPHNFVLEEGVHSTTSGTEAESFDFKLDENGNKIQRYDEALYIGTTQADGTSTDLLTIFAAVESAKSDYCLMNGDCSDVVSEGLSVTESSEGTPIQNGEISNEQRKTIMQTCSDPMQQTTALLMYEMPNVKQDQIEARNPGAAVRADEVVKPDSTKGGIGAAAAGVGTQSK